MDQVYQGEYKIEAVRPDGTCRTLECFQNMIVDVGLDEMMSRPDNSTNYGQRLALVVGQGNTPSSPTDENMAAQLGPMIQVNSISDYSSDMENGLAVLRLSWTGTGGVGEHAGNISEAGVYLGRTTSTINDSNRVLFSRALVRNSEGDPTTITILDSEYLRLTYTLTVYFPKDTWTQLSNNVAYGVISRNIENTRTDVFNPLLVHLRPTATNANRRFRLSSADVPTDPFAAWPTSGVTNIACTATREGQYIPGSFIQKISQSGTFTAPAGTNFRYAFMPDGDLGIIPPYPLTAGGTNVPFKFDYTVALKRTGAYMKNKLFGEYRLVKYQGEDIAEDTGWFQNMIVDQGLDQLAGTGSASSWGISQVVLGTGTAATNQLDTVNTFTDPQYADATVDGNPVRVVSPRRLVYQQFEATFPVGSLNGTYYEVGGLFSPGILFSRSLIADSNGTPSSIFVDASESLKVYYRVAVPLAQSQRGVINGVGLTYYQIDQGGSDSLYHPLAFPGKLPANLYVSALPATGSHAAISGGALRGIESVQYDAYVPGSFRRRVRVTTTEATSPVEWRSFYFQNQAGRPNNSWAYSLDVPYTQQVGERMVLDFELTWGRDDGITQ